MWGDHKDTDLTSDGEWILFWDTVGAVCGGDGLERVARSRSDGTQYEVIITYDQLTAVEANQAPGNQMDCTRLEMSGDGRYALLRSSFETVACSFKPPTSFYWIDIEAKQIGHLTYEGQEVLHPTLTDSGTLCFGAWNAEETERSIYVASEIDGSDAVKVFTGPSEGFMHSVISGDGSKVLVQIRLAPPPFEGDLHLVDVATGAVEQVTSLHDPALNRADISDDGSRIIYATTDERVTTILADGTVVFDRPTGDFSATGVSISGDGEWIRYQIFGEGTTTLARFDGTDPRDLPLVSGEKPTFSMNTRGLSHDGHVLVGERSIVEPFDTVGRTSVWNADGPNLYVSGFAAPATPIQVVVGGELGSAYVIGVSLTAASIPVPPVGRLTIDPATAQVLEMGVIANTLESSETSLYHVPADLQVPPDLDLYFQAYVVSPGGPPRLTNGATFTIRDYDPLP